MLARRTRARLQVVAHVSWALVVMVVAKRQPDLELWRPPALPFGSGFVYAVLYHVVHDHDLGGIRRSRPRRFAFVALVNAIRISMQPRPVVDRYGFGLGQCLGTVVYRLRYGVLGAFPK